MADLNALIAQGYQFQAPPDPFVQYGKMQQLQQGEQTNQLNQMKMQEYQRGIQQQNALNQAYSSAIDPTTGEIDYGKVRNAMAQSGAGSQIPAIEEARLKQETAKATKQKLLGEIALQPVALAAKKLEVVKGQMEQSFNLLDRIDPYSPNAVDQLMAWHENNHAPGLLGDTLRANGSTPEKTIPAIQAAAAQGPQAIADFITKSKIGQQKFAELIAPKPKEMTDGQVKFFIDENPRSPTFGQKIGGEDVQIKMSPYETAHLPVQQQTANLAQQKFEYEKANPGFEVKEVPQADGTIKFVGINKRTGVATPITSGETNLTAPNLAAQRLSFDQSKFNWEKANPGKTIKEVPQADGTMQFFAIDNRTGSATPVMMGGASSGGQGSVSGTNNQIGAGMPLVGAKPSNAQASEGERKAATLLQRLQFSQSQLTQALGEDPKASKPGLLASAVAKLSTPLANTLTAETRQRVESAQLDMLDAALTLGTGAAYTKEQLEGYRQSYFPQIGDGPQQVKDKQARLENIISAAKISAGRAEKLVPQTPGASSFDAADAILAKINQGRR